MSKKLIIGSRQRINPTEVSTEQAAQSLVPYIKEGITHFDTADHYADGEEILGILKQQYRDQITVGTKRCPAPGSVQDGEVRKAVELSLERLKSNTIDLMQFHDRIPENGNGIARLRQLQQLQQEGLIKNLGLTNANTHYLKSLQQEGISIATNQVCCSLFAQRPDSQMMQFCLENDIEILAFGTVAGGFFSEKRLGKVEPKIDELSNASLRKYKRFMDVVGGRSHFQELLQVLDIIAKGHQVSIATIASTYILNQPTIGAVIIGARLGESSHIEENKKTLSLQLTDVENIMIQSVLNKASPLLGDFGDEYRLDHSDYPGGHEFLTSTGGGGYKGHQTDYIK